MEGQSGLSELFIKSVGVRFSGMSVNIVMDWLVSILYNKKKRLFGYCGECTVEVGLKSQAIIVVRLPL